MFELYQQFRQPFSELNELVFSDIIHDSAFNKKVEEQFTKRVKTIITHPATENSEKIIWDTYFNYAGLLLSRNRLFRTNLPLELEIKNILSDSLRHIYGNPNSGELNEFMFYASPPYREFLFSRVKSNNLFNSFSITSNTKISIDFFTTQNCYKSMVLFLVPTIQQWYLTKTIMEGFEDFPFDDANKAYQIFLSEIKNPIFKDSLQQFYGNMLRLKPGNTAPEFTLKNLKGEQVSLSDFKGKIVYIDFWGVYCGPCRGDIIYSIPKLHEKYKDKDVVFLNICVDVGEKKWKAGVKELQFNGINLLAEGWTENPVCQNYNVTAIPHYVLIDKEGKIANNNASSPSELLGAWENELDELLKE